MKKLVLRSSVVPVGIVFCVVNVIHLGSSEFGVQVNFGMNVVVTTGALVVTVGKLNGGFVV